MLKILLIEDDSALVDKMTFILEGISGALISTATDFTQAQKILEEQPSTNLIIADYRCGQTPEVDAFQKASVFIDAIVSVDDAKDPNAGAGWKAVAKIERAYFASKLKYTIEKLYQEKLENTEKLKFCRIKTSLLLETSPLHADIYAKLSDTKYLKIFLEGDVFDAEDFKKYTEQKKIEYMYLREDNCSTFIHKYVDLIDSFIKKKNPPTQEQLSSLSMVAYESVQELTNTLGFTKEVQQVAKSHIQMTVQFMDKKPNLTKLLKRLNATKGKYLADHSFLVSYVACGIATNLQWGSEATFFKLSLASFLHDIALTNEKAAVCSTVEEALALGLPEKEMILFKNHPNIAAEMVRKMNEVPPDVDVIISQHHELPDGTGFPHAISANYIAPLSTVFIIAHDMVKNIFFPPPEGFEIGAYLDQAQERFPSSHFKRVLAAARKLEIPE